ncbi:hypothetical protein DFS34DRAFT_591327 [Phlyctochytrium arcticum]|nr:hypothetical protein DFS34DRAFT_591327 [Phlyctochytrium arcticum]
MDPADVHPKIQTESKEDILHLKAVLLSHAKSQIGEPQHSNLSKEEKIEAEKRLEAWVEEIFALAADNILINGVNYNKAFEEQVEYEPLSEHLANTLSQTHTDLTNLQVDLSALRKEVPKRIGQDTALLGERESNMSARLGSTLPQDDRVVDTPTSYSDWEAAEEMYKEASSKPINLYGDLDQGYERLQRAGRALHDMEARRNAADYTPPNGNFADENFPMQISTPRRARSDLLSKLGSKNN